MQNFIKAVSELKALKIYTAIDVKLSSRKNQKNPIFVIW